MYLVVAGNIGAGKTTLTGKLARHYNWKAEYETVDYNPYLEDFYKDMKQWAFHLQIFFLNTRFNGYLKSASKGITLIQDRSIYEDANVFALNLHQNGIMETRDYKNYLGIYETLIRMVEPPKLLIYLKASVPTLMDRIRKRNREMEAEIDPNYIAELNSNYNYWISTYRLSKLLVINVDNLDFVEKEDDFLEIVQRIDRILLS